jgi:hypothetical protein
MSGSQEAALQTLQTSIVRLADRQALQLAAEKRQEYRALVEEALKAYRGYMKAISH